MNMQHFFSPRTIAVIGVSRNKNKLGSRVYYNLHDGGYRGRLVPVNPNIPRVAGQRCFSSVLAVPGRIDVAIIVTPAPTVPGIIEECGRARIPYGIVISSGFKETGPAGEARERDLKRRAGKYNLRLLGPNCLGFLHGDNRINASFSRPLEPGGTGALISQSGALAAAITDWGKRAKVGFRAVISLGNSAGLTETDFLNHFRQDKKTKAILLYLESISNGPAFLEEAKRTVKVKPVIVFKAGLSELGQAAAKSHTGALASSREVTLAALQSAGVLVATTVEELYDLAMVFSTGRRLHGKRLAIVTNAGGPAIIATDAIAQTPLHLSTLTAATVRKLTRTLPFSASVANPIDLIGDADELRYRRALNALAADPTVDGLLVILTPQVVTQPSATAETVVQAQRRYPKKPIVAAWLGGKSVAGAQAIFEKNRLPHFTYPENGIRAFQRMSEYETARRQPRQQIIFPRFKFFTRSQIPTDGLLLPPATQKLLRRFGFRIAPYQVAKNIIEAIRVSRKLRFPLAVKLLSHRVIHKEKKKAIWLRLADPTQLRRQLRQSERQFPASYRRGADEGWMLQPMVSGRREWFLGGKRDATFGPVIVIGIGGTEVESEARILTLLPPFTTQAIRRQLEESPLANQLRQSVGDRSLDRTALYRAAAQLGLLLQTYPQISELDINPYLVGASGDGGVVIDARAIITEVHENTV